MTDEASSNAGVIAQAAIRPDQPALICGEVVRTYGELNERARRLAHVLAGLGVDAGDRVAILVPNSIEFMEALHATGHLRAVAVPVNVHFKADEVGWIVRDSGARAVVVHERHLDALSQVPEVSRLVIGDGEEADYERRIAGVSTPGEVRDPEDGWPVTMLYTSGTTGRPKGIAMADDDFRRFAAGWYAVGARWGLDHTDTHIVPGPLYHAGPLAWANMHLTWGGTVVIMPRFDAEELLALIERWGVSSSNMVPIHFARILALPEEVRDRYDLSSIKFVMHAGAPCPIDLKRRFMAFIGQDKVYEYFGASEGGGTTITPQEWLERPGSIGKPQPGTEFVVMDDDGTILPPGEVGTLYVKVASSSFRYHNDDAKTASTRRGDFFTVGDAGWIDEDGYIFLADRTSDMVISGGVNIYPREIEEVLDQHPEIVDAVAFGVPDDEWGEALVALVQPAEGSDLTGEDAIEWVRSRLADFKRPREVELVAEVPRDPNGKVRKPQLRERWVAARAQASNERR
jgi:long-chain acyl-CoA synthetase